MNPRRFILQMRNLEGLIVEVRVGLCRAWPPHLRHVDTEMRLHPTRRAVCFPSRLRPSSWLRSVAFTERQGPDAPASLLLRLSAWRLVALQPAKPDRCPGVLAIAVATVVVEAFQRGPQSSDFAVKGFARAEPLIKQLFKFSAPRARRVRPAASGFRPPAC